jgi:lipid-binding SYLF domain-containing protein
MGVGGQIGAEATNHVLVLTTDAAVKTFTGKGQFTLGAEVGVALGPVGRNAQAQIGFGRKGFAPILSYSHSKGLFAGVSVEGAVIAVRPDVNKTFYGINLTPREILTKGVHRPVAATPLYEALSTAFKEPSHVEPTFTNSGWQGACVLHTALVYILSTMRCCVCVLSYSALWIMAVWVLS